uniref:Uncharacterized protein n=1 Tax=viral metagenome TaxID=1070528 RepID=A0A6H2A2P0_9ZZZZ
MCAIAMQLGCKKFVAEACEVYPLEGVLYRNRQGFCAFAKYPETTPTNIGKKRVGQQKNKKKKK